MSHNNFTTSFIENWIYVYYLPERQAFSVAYQAKEIQSFDQAFRTQKCRIQSVSTICSHYDLNINSLVEPIHLHNILNPDR